MRLSNLNAIIATFAVSAILYCLKGWLKKMGIIIPNYVIGAVGISGLVYVAINIFLSKKPTKANLSLEIDHDLKLLHDFWDEIWGELETSPITLAQAFNKSQQVVAETPSSEKIHAIRKDYYLTEVPSWHHKIFDSTESFHGLSEGEQQDVRQFYDNLGTITSTYENLRTSNQIYPFESIAGKVGG